MKQYIFIALVLMSVLLLTGCNTDSTPTGPTYAPFVGGTNGVVMELIPGMPPTTEGAILDGGRSSFSIGVKVINKGEFDLEEGDLSLEVIGLYPSHFGVTYPDLAKILEDPVDGTKKQITGETVPGQFTTLVFEDLSYLPDSQGDWVQNFKVKSCYHYKTKSATPICVANDVTGALTDTDTNPICEVNGAKSTENSGAPIKITNVKQMPQGSNKISISFDIVHQGTGNVYASTTGVPTNCDTALQNPDRNKATVSVYLSDQSSANTQVTCTGGFDGSLTPTQDNPLSSELVLSQGIPRIVTCTVQETTVGQDVIATDLLYIDVDYNYGEILNGNFVVKDIGSVNE
jgi:hypothetical protein